MSISAQRVVRKTKVRFRYQVKENGVVKDLTNMTFSLGVKAKASDTTYKIGPVSGVVENPATDGIFYVELTDTHTDQAPFAGWMEVIMVDAGGARTALTPAMGVRFWITENIID